MKPIALPFPAFSIRSGPAPLLAALLAGLFLAAAPSLTAGDAPDPSGVWKWSFTLNSGDTLNLSATLKRQGDKITGVYVGPRGDKTPIKQGKFENGALSFTVVRQINGNPVTLKYSGKLAGDTLKGRVEFERDGESNSRDWEAKRATAVANASGLWKWTITTQDGQSFEPKLRLKQTGEKLTGASIWGDNETPITEGSVKDGDIFVKVLSDRDGRPVTTIFRGKFSGNAIKGTWQSDWSGEKRTRDWKAVRAPE